MRYRGSSAVRVEGEVQGCVEAPGVVGVGVVAKGVCVELISCVVQALCCKVVSRTLGIAGLCWPVALGQEVHF